MSNVISLGLPKRPSLSQRQGALLKCFAHSRRGADDVFWLKENAELLNVLATSGAKLDRSALAVYAPFYDTIEERLRFFPQYYRFLLSICLDLEDLGMDGDKGVALCTRARDLKLADCELSDLQRAEAQRLFARRGCGAIAPELNARLQDFMAHSGTFALPNKKAAYELTHIVYYLSDYGKQPVELSEEALTSLDYVGLLAFLDRDVDLLSEVCVALRFAGRQPSDIWEDWLSHEVQGFVLSAVPDGPVSDCYHEYFVSSWWAQISGREGFLGRPSRAGIEIRRAHPTLGPLRMISELMYQLGPARSGNWSQMRKVLGRCIGAEHQHVLEEAAQSSSHFDDFFKGFARA